ncbi:uncharacterized protein LOC117136320 isoform X3 [Drosophila mauritiana]|uniref:Uncharacterized protein LOC117136320 isoform X3 n=1 Tax=Drosophila mauritiana TaxID=7226 RepID=A0A6P8JBZ9_DROMA|nr:uncharacterized protein LOC117136320 isoform X3 [Drosophila mauritiana]
MLIDLSWSLVLSAIIGTYLNESTICIFWNDKFEFHLLHKSDYISFVGINIKSFDDNRGQYIVDKRLKEKDIQNKNLFLDDLVIKIIISIEVTHCETFVVFDKDIDRFVNAFTKASVYSIWRSLHNKFVFAHIAYELPESHHHFFEDQPNILFVVRDHSSASSFDIKTNKFVGRKEEKPSQMILVDRYLALEQRFQFGISLFADKLNNMQGREVIIAGFDYPPYTVIKHNMSTNAQDMGVSEDSDFKNVYIDGTETRIILNFCEKFNCTIQIDSSAASDWGNVYPNMSGDGALGMLINRKADICIGAMYSWYEDYTYLDLSMYLVRSGITCLVPAPLRLTSWYLPLEPFEETLWAAILLCLCAEATGLVLAFKRNSKAYSLTVRVLLFACFLNDLIITSIYGGGLASILTIPSLDEAADTVPRLRFHRLQWAANSEAWVSAIRASDEALVKDILYNFHIYSDDELLRLAQDQHVRIGFTVERLPFGHFAIGNYLGPQAIDQLVIMKDDIYFQYTVAFVPRLWPLLDKLNTLIYSWHSSGFDKYWEYRVVADNLNLKIQQQVQETMTGSKDIGPVPLGMSNFAGFIIVWILGSAIATLTFLLELSLTYILNEMI